MSRRAATLLVCGPLVFSLIACSFESDPEEQQYRGLPITVIIGEPGPAGLLAQIRGELALTDGCLILVSTSDVPGEETRRVSVPVLASYLEPRWEEAEDGSSTLHLLGQEFSLGEQVIWGGGEYGTVESFGKAAQLPVVIPDECSSNFQVYVVEGI